LPFLVGHRGAENAAHAVPPDDPGERQRHAIFGVERTDRQYRPLVAQHGFGDAGRNDPDAELARLVAFDDGDVGKADVVLDALANPKIGEREVLAAMLDVEAAVVAEHDGILLISDKGFASTPFERQLAEQGIELLRPSRKKEKTRYGEPMLKKVRQLIESVNDTLKGQLDLEQHGGRTFAGVAVRVAQRLLAMTAAIWHNNKTSAPVTRSLIAYDH